MRPPPLRAKEKEKEIEIVTNNNNKHKIKYFDFGGCISGGGDSFTAQHLSRGLQYTSSRQVTQKMDIYPTIMLLQT